MGDTKVWNNPKLNNLRNYGNTATQLIDTCCDWSIGHFQEAIVSIRYRRNHLGEM